MPTLLHLDSSPRGERSHSRQLTAEFARQWQTAHPGGAVIYHDLGRQPVPLVTEEWISGAYSPPQARTSAQAAAIAVSDQLVDELLAADLLLIGAPMYNFAVPASLKAWVDQVVRAGRTFDPATYSGLAVGKHAVVITARGGAGYGPGEAMAAMNHEDPYLRTILGFVGITEIEFIHTGNLSGSDEMRQSALTKAHGRIATAAGAAR